jgi:hypothetical protein
MAMGRAAWAIDVDARPAAAWFEDALQIFREVDEPTGIGWMLSFTAQERWRDGDLAGALDRATEAFNLGTRSGLLQVVAESRRVLAMVATTQGRRADAERLLEEAAAAHEQAGDDWQLALILTITARLAFDRGDDARAFRKLRRALRLARDGGMGERMWDAVELTAIVVHHRGRVREVATLVGVVEAVDQRFPRMQERVQERIPVPLGLPLADRRLASTQFSALASMVPAELDEHRVAGRSLSLERATDLALRVLDEELALAATPAGGGSEAAGEAPPAPAATASDDAGVFRREGDVWTVTWAGRTVRLRHARGFAYLAVLLRHPDRELHATDIVRVAGGDEVGEGPRSRPDRELATGVDLGHAGPILDARAHAAYRARLAELREELAEAEGLNDLGGVERRREEIAALVQQLAGAKRGRTAAAHGERARVAVTKGLKGALERIAASHPELGRHLTATVRRGYFCVYRPDPVRPARWDA